MCVGLKPKVTKDHIFIHAKKSFVPRLILLFACFLCGTQLWLVKQSVYIIITREFPSELK